MVRYFECLRYFRPIEPTKLFRISFNKFIPTQKGDGRLEKISDLLGPPENKSTYGRCNFPGESVFYSSLFIKTAILETKPVKNDFITLTEWHLKPGKSLLGTCIFHHPDVVSANKESKEAYDGYLLEMEKTDPILAQIVDSILKFLTEEYIKPVQKDKPREYLFSAHFSSVLLKSKSPEGQRIEAIMYPSVQNKYEVTNIAIVNSIVLDRFDLISVRATTVIETLYGKPPPANVGILNVQDLYDPITNFDIPNNKIIYDNSAEFHKLVQNHIAQQKAKNG